MKAKTKQPIQFSKDLELALKGFTPIFGSEDDISIAEDMGKLQKKLGEIDTVAFRKAEEDRDDKKLTSKMKEIQREEKNLVYRITRRNFDF